MIADRRAGCAEPGVRRTRRGRESTPTPTHTHAHLHTNTHANTHTHNSRYRETDREALGTQGKGNTQTHSTGIYLRYSHGQNRIRAVVYIIFAITAKEHFNLKFSSHIQPNPVVYTYL